MSKMAVDIAFCVHYIEMLSKMYNHYLLTSYKIATRKNSKQRARIMLEHITIDRVPYILYIYGHYIIPMLYITSYVVIVLSNWFWEIQLNMFLFYIPVITSINICYHVYVACFDITYRDTCSGRVFVFLSGSHVQYYMAWIAIISKLRIVRVHVLHFDFFFHFMYCRPIYKYL